MRRRPGPVVRESARDLRHSARYRALRRRLRAAPRHGDIAAVVHVWYPELWASVEAALDRLPFALDVVVTLPDGVPDPVGARARTRVVRVPNRGRDVLPFSHVAAALADAGYAAVLKLHTKRSTHFTGGDAWFGALLEALVPADAGRADGIRAALDRPATALVGAAEHYHPFPLYLAENLADTRRDLDRLLGRPRAGDVLADPAAYGFFAGTMFWARLDALTGFLALPVHRFPVEAGQVNGTYAHTVERLLCVVPQVLGRELWETDAAGVRPRDPRTDRLPPWAGPEDLRL